MIIANVARLRIEKDQLVSASGIFVSWESIDDVVKLLEDITGFLYEMSTLVNDREKIEKLMKLVIVHLGHYLGLHVIEFAVPIEDLPARIHDAEFDPAGISSYNASLVKELEDDLVNNENDFRIHGTMERIHWVPEEEWDELLKEPFGEGEFVHITFKRF